MAGRVTGSVLAAAAELEQHCAARRSGAPRPMRAPSRAPPALIEQR
jgi:hypothetical protein